MITKHVVAPALGFLLSLATACGGGDPARAPDGGVPDGMVPDGGPEPDAPPPGSGPAAGAWRRFALPGVSGTSRGANLGAVGQVDDIAVAPDGTVYLAGSFSDAAGLAANNIVAWTGNDYRALGDGIAGRVAALAIDGDGTLWAAGTTDDAGAVISRLYRWTGTVWQVIAGQLDHAVSDLQSVGPDLIVVGSFQHAGNVAAAKLARFDGAAWHAIPSSSLAGVVTTIAPTPNGFCVAGEFVAIGNVAANNAACWDGATWQALGTGLGARVSVLARSPGGTWYAGGRFSMPGTPDADPGVAIARLGANGTWAALEAGVRGGFTSHVRDITFSGDGIVIGGDFALAGRDLVATRNLARWSPLVGWSAVGAGVSGLAGGAFDPNAGVHALGIAPGGNLCAGGVFLRSGDVPAVNVVRIAPLGEAHAMVGPRVVNGIGGFVRALASRPDGTLIAGGRLEFGGQVPLDQLATFGGTTWSGWSGLGGDVHDLQVLHDGSIAVAGELTLGAERSAVAIWKTDAWTLRGGAVEGAGTVVFEDSQHRVWLGLEILGGSTKLVSLDGDTWTERGQFELWGSSGLVSALAEWDGRIVVGGMFRTVNGNVISNLAVADGTGGWSALGGGTGAGTQVTALATSPSLGLLVGGTFDQIGTTPVNNLAAWNGLQWRDLAGGVTATDWPVRVLQPHGEGVFVAGDFDRAGTIAAARIAWFDGTAWHALDGGVDNAAQTMVVRDDVLYVGGAFVEAGGQTSARIAAWDFATH